jgi:DNA repair photolyase
MTGNKSDQPRKGRGASINPTPRFVKNTRAWVDDGWERDEEENGKTEIFIDASRTIITYNQSPDVPFDRSINPYKGCEHGCIYCFARPSHAYLDLSPGLDFETKIFAKPDAPELLQYELSKPGYQPAPIALGVNTDAYQPIERELKITRRLLEVLEQYRHPVVIVTKSSLIERDMDLLSSMAARNLVKVMVSVTGLDRELSRRMEPRAASPERRLRTIRTLTEAGIPVGILFAPVIPALNDNQMEAILAATAQAGARSAAYVVLRLPLELTELFQKWLRDHYPLKADRIMGIVRNLRNGKTNSANFGDRMTGTGEYAHLIRQRFKLASKTAGLDQSETELDLSLFRILPRSGDQLTLL